MPTTSNFGWTTPADTDLVKDGAAAIRTLGNGIDTSLVDLKGGTTGQILSKASNTDLDYTWITNDVGDITNVAVTSPITGGGSSGSVTIGIQDGTTTQKGAVQLENSTSSTSTTTAAVPASVKSAYDLANAAIPKSLVDAAGDLIYATANDTVARLALGTAGQVLKVNSTATAPEWGAAASASGLTRITTNTFSAQTSINLSNVFSATYDNYLVVAYATQSTADTIFLRLRTGSTNYTTGDQKYGTVEGNYSGTVSGYGSTVQTAVFQASSGTDRLSLNAFIFNPYNTIRTQAFGGRVDNSVLNNWAYSAGNTTSYESLNFSVGGGNFTGEISVYGFARS